MQVQVDPSDDGEGMHDSKAESGDVNNDEAPANTVGDHEDPEDLEVAISLKDHKYP